MWSRPFPCCPVIAEQRTGEAVHVNAQFFDRAGWADVMRYPDTAVQQRVKRGWGRWLASR
jgi:hypothetical protein